jgi:ABC-type antimicrobial peptide transport system permease subunit
MTLARAARLDLPVGPVSTATSSNASVIVIALNSTQEELVSIGRAYEHRPLELGEVHVSAPLLRRLQVEPNSGTNLTLIVDLLGLIRQQAPDLLSGLTAASGAAADTPLTMPIADLIAAFDESQPTLNGTNLLINAYDWLEDNFFGFLPERHTINLNGTVIDVLLDLAQDALTLVANVTVVDAIETPGGKYPKALGNVALMESTTAQALIESRLEALAATLRNVTQSPLRLGFEVLLNITDAEFMSVFETAEAAIESAEGFDLNNYAMSIIGTAKDRLNIYMQDNVGVTLSMVELTNAVSDGLGDDLAASVSLTAPMASAVGALYFIRLFLDQIFTFVTVVLSALGALLIYSLMLSNVDERTYEYGMLRALGMRQPVLIQLLLVQASYYSIPGAALGLLFAVVLFIPVAWALSTFIIVPFDMAMDAGSIMVAVALGLLVPIVSNMVPIRRALSSTLRDALDVYHSTKSSVQVTIIKLEKIGLSPWQVSVALLMVIMGFVVYYLMPLSFVFMDLGMFLFLLTAILIGMLIGLALVSTVLEPLAERFVIWAIVWGNDRACLADIVVKNLSAHAPRNRKTASMFTVALAFIVFVGMTFSLQGHSIRDNVRLGLGSDVVVLSFRVQQYLDEPAMRAYLEEEVKRVDSPVVDFAFQSFPLDNLVFVTGTELSNLAGFPAVNVRVVSVDESFLAATYADYYRPTELQPDLDFADAPNGAPDAIASLTTNAGKVTLPIEASLGAGVAPPDITSAPTFPPDDNNPTPVSMNTTSNPSFGTPINLTNEEVYEEYYDVVVSEAMRLAASIDVQTPLYLRLDYRLDGSNSSTLYLLCKAHALVAKLASDLQFSSYQQFATNSLVFMSPKQLDALYRRLLNATVLDASLPWTAENAETLPKAKLFVRLHEDASLIEREFVMNSLRNFVTDDLTQVVDTVTLVESTQTALDLLNYFFIAVTVIAVTLCFFVLWLSFTANIRENAWELGVLRALGLTEAQVVRVYVYEAVALIASSVVLGTTIGILQATTLTLQFNLFTELPFTFDFPLPLYATVIVLSTGAALGGSVFPARKFQRRPIAQVLKG